MSHIKSFQFPFFLVMGFALLGCCASRADDAKSSVAATTGKCLLYVGTYTGAKSKGIYKFEMDLRTGALSPLGVAAETPNPTFLDFDPHGKFLYAVNEIGDFGGKSAGSLSAFSIEPETGKLALLNRTSTVGSGPCHVVVDRTGRDALVANYGSGSVAVLPIDSDGMVGAASAFMQHEGSGPNHARQEHAHAHCVTLDAANKFAFVCDLGIDKIMVYQFDAGAGTLKPNDPPFMAIKPGSGPRHLTFSRDGRNAYLISELASAVTVFAYDAGHGALREMQTISTLPADFKGENISAEIAISPNGRYLYASNRGHDSITIFGIDPRKGTLGFAGRQPTEGRTPRHFAFSPNGRFLVAADQDSNKLVVFEIAPKVGLLIPTSHEAEVTAPVCVKFLPTH